MDGQNGDRPHSFVAVWNDPNSVLHHVRTINPVSKGLFTPSGGVDDDAQAWKENIDFKKTVLLRERGIPPAA